MHEVAIIRDILETLETQYGSEIQRIQKVVVEAGLLCNVQPVLIQNAYEAMILEDDRLAAIELEIKVLPIIAFCSTCHQEFRVIRHRFVCGCGAPSRQIVQGEELRISEVIFN